MSIFSMVVVYILIWWTALFAVLPVGVRGQAEEGNIVEGSEPGAPVDSQIKRKLILTTIVSFVVWAVVCLAIVAGLIDYKSVSYTHLTLPTILLV